MPRVWLWNSEHILQTPSWGELKGQFGWQWEKVNDTIVLFRRLPLGLKVAYVPRGPRLPLEPATLTALEAACRARGAFFLKLEPDVPDSAEAAGQLAAHGFRPALQTIQPRRSIIIDISGTEDEVLARMKQKTRYNLKLATKKEVTIRTQDKARDLSDFTALLQTTGTRDGFSVHAARYYQAAYALFQPCGQCELFIAEFHGQPLAGVMAFALGQRAWYFYGASSNEERQRMAPYLAQWAAMQWARERGATEYDLWGVPDEDEAQLEEQFETRHDGLWGVYRFKRGWGGQLVRTVGAWDKVFNPALYQAYLLYLRFRKTSLS
jgi:lipid II:glycine glycyltransferase (peptidoglycan interpeptide bridge formation enzyme)